MTSLIEFFVTLGADVFTDGTVVDWHLSLEALSFVRTASSVFNRGVSASLPYSVAQFEVHRSSGFNLNMIFF